MTWSEREKDEVVEHRRQGDIEVRTDKLQTECTEATAVGREKEVTKEDGKLTGHC